MTESMVGLANERNKCKLKPVSRLKYLLENTVMMAFDWGRTTM